MYEFKAIPEAVRAAGFAAIVFGLQLLVEFNIDEAAVDWQTYMKAGASGLVAAAAAGALGAIKRS